MVKFETFMMGVLVAALIYLGFALYSVQDTKNVADVVSPPPSGPVVVRPYVTVIGFIEYDKAYQMTQQEKEKFMVNN